VSREDNYSSFINWDSKLRGWDVFDNPVQIEPVNQEIHYPNEYLNDGGRFRIFSKKRKKTKRPNLEPMAYEFVTDEQLVAYEIICDENKLTPSEIDGLIIALTFSNEPITFEVEGDSERIVFRFVCYDDDSRSLNATLKAYFGKRVNVTRPALSFVNAENLGIIDFGLFNSISQPLAKLEKAREPLLSVLTVLEDLQEGERMLYQFQFKYSGEPWKSIYAGKIIEGKLDKYFSDNSETFRQFEEKFESDIFSCRVRLVIDCMSPLSVVNTAMRGVFSMGFANSDVNGLFPLSNEYIGYEDHLDGVLNRTFTRPGFLLSKDEVKNFISIPELLPNIQKLIPPLIDVDIVPDELTKGKYILGFSGDSPVCVDDDKRLKHHFVLGSTGVGKSTFMVSQAIQDALMGNGFTVIDPHGDLIDDVLKRLPEHRLSDVVIFDPSDSEYPVGFNLLQSNSEAESIILNSDLVSVFKSSSTSWGDQMSSILSNVISVFLEPDVNGTLLEVQQFLTNVEFRDEVLNQISDPVLLHYWRKEFPQLRKGTLSPILTRLGTFLRSKVVRNMMAIKEGVSMRDVIDSKKILLVKLSQGLIGEENSQMLGKLVLAKLYQSALGRQNLNASERHPHYVFMDEFHNFISPSFSGILTGIRKYGLGLTCACQNLVQLKKVSGLQETILSNAFIRTVFRVGDEDAQIIGRNSEKFDALKYLNLSRGQSIVRAGKATTECEMRTLLLDSERDSFSTVVEDSRKKYATDKSDVEEIIKDLYSPDSKAFAVKKEIPEKQEKPEKDGITDESSFEKKKEEFHYQEAEKEKRKLHTKALYSIKELAQNLGWRVQVEYPVENGRIDLVIENENGSTAIEVSITNSVAYEVQNLKKCIDSGFSRVLFVSDSAVKNNAILEKMSEVDQQEIQIKYLTEVGLISWLQENAVFSDKEEKIGGYTIKTSFVNQKNEDELAKRVIDILTKRNPK